MSDVVEPCYHGGALEPHEFARDCPGHRHTGLIPEMADWLDRLDDGDPEAIKALNRLWRSMGFPPLPEESEPLRLDPQVQAEVNRKCDEFRRHHGQAAASGQNYFIGGSALAPSRPTVADERGEGS